MKQPCEICEQLRDQDFDVILFQEWMALGHACVIAKKCGLAFQQTVLATIAHASEPWILAANSCFPKTSETLALSYLEQWAIEESDALVSPSNYLVNWMRLQGWNLPEATNVIPITSTPRTRASKVVGPEPAGPVVANRLGFQTDSRG
jgi:O-antigen biosynthesis protein